MEDKRERIIKEIRTLNTEELLMLKDFIDRIQNKLSAGESADNLAKMIREQQDKGKTPAEIVSSLR